METRFAKVGDAHIAFRVLGDGPIDLLLFLGEYIPVDALEEEPRLARAMSRLQSVGRVIIFNRRGVGISDAPDGRLTHEQHLEDALAVMDEVSSSRAVVLAAAVGGPAALLFAARHPDRTSALVIVNSYARLIRADDYPYGREPQVMNDAAEQVISSSAENFDFLTYFAPTLASDQRFRAWWDQAGHRGASPGRSKQLWGLLGETDVRHALPSISAPTLVLGRSQVPPEDREVNQYIAQHIEGARYVELPGDDLLWWAGDCDALLDQVETFLASTVGSTPRSRRMLATVLFIDIVASTEQAASIGDQRWRELLSTYHDVAQRQFDRFGGRRANTSGDGVVATFEIPADAIRCARSIAEDARALGIGVRAGIHIGEIETVGEDVAGVGVHIAARVMAIAGPGEVLVSRTVTDLVTGSGIAFADRGEHDLKGVPGRWQLFAVA